MKQSSPLSRVPLSPDTLAAVVSLMVTVPELSAHELAVALLTAVVIVARRE